MKFPSTLLAVSFIALVTACSDNMDRGDAATGNDSAVQDDTAVRQDSATNGEDAASGGDSSTPTVDPADCPAIAAGAVAAQMACSGSVAPGAEAAFRTACERGIPSSNLCGGNVTGAFACFRSPDPSDWLCQLGTVYPSCNTDLEAAIGLSCVLALGNPECASIACEFSTDCPGSALCNGRTGKCVSSTAYCVGLPCENSTDCPTGETCNGAIGACIRN